MCCAFGFKFSLACSTERGECNQSPACIEYLMPEQLVTKRIPDKCNHKACYMKVNMQHAAVVAVVAVIVAVNVAAAAARVIPFVVLIWALYKQRFCS